MKIVMGTILILLCFLFIGCSSNSTIDSTPSPTSLHVLRRAGNKLFLSADLDKTISNIQIVQGVYQAALRLRKATSGGSYSCPQDNGVHYLLDFQQGGTTQVMDLSVTGCMFLKISDTDWRWTDSAFQSLVARAIGISVLT